MTARFFIIHWLFLIQFLLVSPSAAGASDHIRSDIEITYRFDPTGQSRVHQQVSLTNLVSQVFTTSYTLLIRGLNLTEISASDSAGPLPVALSQLTPNQASATVDFSAPAAGKNRSQSFSLDYPGPRATKNGQIWELALPKYSLSQPMDTYTLILEIPASMGLPAFISPPPSATDTDRPQPGITRYTFASPTAASGIVAAFGDFQTLDFDLTYHLSNSSWLPKSQTLALPPDTPSQKLFYTSLEPRPSSITSDIDGNWLATYRLRGRESVTVTAVGQAHVLSNPVGASASPSAQLMDYYLRPSAVWPTTDSRIADLSTRLTTPRAIYDYVVSTLDYDSDRAYSNPVRTGALGALANPKSALCTEFTDLFITLARAAGIPAREVQGYALTDNSRLRPLGLLTDVLHSWPEYWDSATHTWRAIDPTWADTSGGLDYFSHLDLAHFAFVIHGVSPDTPLPAGMYKQGSNSKDVQVQVGDYKDYFLAPLQTKWQPPWQFLPFITNRSRLTVANPNGVALYHLQVLASATGIWLSGLPPADISVLPPFASIDITLNFRPSLWPAFATKYLTFQVGSQTLTYNISDYQFLVWYGTVIIILTGCVLLVASAALKAWHLYFQKYRR